MLEKKIVFEDKSKTQIIENADLMRNFWGQTTGLGHFEFYKKISSSSKASFEFFLMPSPLIYSQNYNKKIMGIDDIRAVGEFMGKMKRHRIIGDTLYKLVDFTEIKKGEFLLTVDGELTFKIIEEDTGWFYKPMEFSLYNNRGKFKHTPDLDSNPRKIELEVSVQNQKKEKLFVKMYDWAESHYARKGLKVLE